MKTIYTFLLCVVASSLFAQDTNSAPIINKPFDVKTKGFWVAASYGYNTRSFIPDFYQPSETNYGHYEPKAYLAGHMPMLEAGYNFSPRIGLFAGFALPFGTKRSYDYVSGKGNVNTNAWYTTLGGQFYVLNKVSKIRPYVKTSFNMGLAKITKESTNNKYEQRGGYMLGGSIVFGTDIKVYQRLLVLVEASFTYMNYRPKELYYNKTGVVTPYSTDISDGFQYPYGYVYISQNLLPEHIPMNFISFRVGLRYNFFGN